MTTTTTIHTTIDTDLRSDKLRSMDVVSQTELAFRHPLPLAIGSLIGGAVPVGTFTVGHYELAQAGWISVPGAIVAGGLLFSAITVYNWGERVFSSGMKALGFVVLAEGIMSFSDNPYLSVFMLAMLVLINAIANGANLAMQYVETQANRQRADAARHADADAERVSPQAVVPGVERKTLHSGAIPSAPRDLVPPATKPTPAIRRIESPTLPTDRRWKPERGASGLHKLPLTTPRTRLHLRRLPTAEIN